MFKKEQSSNFNENQNGNSKYRLFEGNQVFLLTMWGLKKNFKHTKRDLIVCGRPFSIDEILPICGKRVTIDKVFYKENAEHNPDNIENIDFVKIKEDKGKYLWIPDMFSITLHNDICVGDKVKYRSKKNLANVHAISGSKYYLEFEEKEDWMHDCKGYVPSGKGWLSSYEDLELISSENREETKEINKNAFERKNEYENSHRKDREKSYSKPMNVSSKNIRYDKNVTSSFNKVKTDYSSVSKKYSMPHSSLDDSLNDFLQRGERKMKDDAKRERQFDLKIPPVANEIKDEISQKRHARQRGKSHYHMFDDGDM